MNKSYPTKNYQLVENGLAAKQLDLNEVQVELYASKCSQYINNAYCFYS